MSAAGEERGNKRGNTDGRPAGQQRQTTTPRDGPSQSRRGGKAPVSTPNMNSKSTEAPSTPVLPPQDEHIPLKGFNVAEVDNLLKKGFDAKAHAYKPEPQQQKAGSVWGAKVGAMANGKDFWLELRKQVTAIQQTGGQSQGG